MSDSVNLTEDRQPDWYSQAQALLQAGKDVAAESFGNLAECIRLRNLSQGMIEQIEVLTRAQGTQREIIEELQRKHKINLGYIQAIKSTLESFNAEENIWDQFPTEVVEFINGFDMMKELRDCGCSDAE